MRKSPTRRSAVTLLEVLVVAAIIALLISILVPSVMSARLAARNMRCVGNLRAYGNSLTFYKTGASRYPIDIPLDGRKRVESLECIGKVAELLVRQSLGDPRTLYCPVSLEDDRHSPPPEQKVFDGVRQEIIQQWRTGQTCYLYLAGVTHTYPDPLKDNAPTFDPATESPDGRYNTRAVLVGDRTVEPGPRWWHTLPVSNHGKAGGWFYYVAGDAGWRSWSTLTKHPANTYKWFWPRTAPPRVAER